MTILDEEVQDTRFPDLVRRLSHQSVVKHFDAYADVAWDSPEFAIDPDGPAVGAAPRQPARWHRLVPGPPPGDAGSHRPPRHRRAT